ncbi:hypothetical protein M427DRAFT_158199 [Gonapodya prolifera JEL478]|uniref:Uncharacterized protein n=1 Tax=Gonapodya prolifera (strain JEL478) TaxID=1344416 RepID=A0A139A3U6_GONPJ|nr:hypothetical protein M427DRAFT_158199 [Gonapodya prolifera JEL478]|eukprot:KXS11460.1 hypothetical protein M427DRAFT_158199 [Gonapodya prolifera JEL478]
MLLMERRPATRAKYSPNNHKHHLPSNRSSHQVSLACIPHRQPNEFHKLAASGRKHTSGSVRPTSSSNSSNARLEVSQARASPRSVPVPTRDVFQAALTRKERTVATEHRDRRKADGNRSKNTPTRSNTTIPSSEAPPASLRSESWSSNTAPSQPTPKDDTNTGKLPSSEENVAPSSQLGPSFPLASSHIGSQATFPRRNSKEEEWERLARETGTRFVVTPSFRRAVVISEKPSSPFFATTTTPPLDMSYLALAERTVFQTPRDRSYGGTVPSPTTNGEYGWRDGAHEACEVWGRVARKCEGEMASAKMFWNGRRRTDVTEDVARVVKGAVGEDVGVGKKPGVAPH